MEERFKGGLDRRISIERLLNDVHGAFSDRRGCGRSRLGRPRVGRANWVALSVEPISIDVDHREVRDRTWL